QAEDGIRDRNVTGVQTCALPIYEGPIGRDDDHVQIVNLGELAGLGVGRARHAGELVIHPEQVLEGDRRQGLVLVGDLDALFRLDRLVQTVGPAASWHQPARELVYDDHFAVLDD